MVTPLFDEEAYWRARREAEQRGGLPYNPLPRCEWCGIEDSDSKPVGRGFAPVLLSAGARKGVQEAAEVMVQTLCRTCAFWLEKAALPTLVSDGGDWTTFRFWLARGIETDPNWPDVEATAFTHLTAIAQHGAGGFGGGCYIAKFVTRQQSKNSPFRYGFWHLPGVWSQGQPESEEQGGRVLFRTDNPPTVNTSHIVDANGKSIAIDPRPVATELYACPGIRPCQNPLRPVFSDQTLAAAIEAKGYGKVE